MKIIISIGLISILYFSGSLAMEQTQENRIGQKLKGALIALSDEAFIYVKDYPKYTPLMKAAEKGDKKTVILLLDADIEINNYWKSLDRAIVNGHIEIVEILLKAAAHVNAKGTETSTLLLAARCGHIKIVELLLDRGVDVNAKNSSNETCLMYAAENGHKEVVSLLLKRGADVNAQDRADHYTALACAASGGHNGIAEMLIDKVANTETTDTMGNTVLMHAAGACDHEVIAKLLARGANINAKDNCGDTTLMGAAMMGNKDVVALLLDNGAHINDTNKYGDTALIKAARHGHKEVVVLLLERGASLDAQDDSGKTALMHVAYENAKEVLAFLLSKNADTSIKDNYNSDTALTLAIKRHNKEAVQLLELYSLPVVQAYLSNPMEYIKRDINRFATIGKRQTWLMVACIFGHTDVISFYKDHSPEYVNTKDLYGFTAFDYTCRYNPASLATLINTFGTKITQLSPQQTSFFTSCISYIPYLCTVSRKDELLSCAVERGMLSLVNALLSIGAQPTIQLAQKAQEKGYLKIMHRLLFSTLASIPGYKRDPYGALSSLFK